MKNFSYLFIGLVLMIFITSTGSCSKDKIAAAPAAECADTISFSAKILPFMIQNCTGCHDMESSNGFTFDNYEDISANADKALNAMKGDGALQMPFQLPVINDSLIQQFSCWISQGKLEN